MMDSQYSVLRYCSIELSNVLLLYSDCKSFTRVLADSASYP